MHMATNMHMANRCIWLARPASYLASTKPLPKPCVEPSILLRVVKAMPEAFATLQGSMVQPLLVQVPLVTFFKIFRPSKALEARTACMALYCTFFCITETHTYGQVQHGVCMCVTDDMGCNCTIFCITETDSSGQVLDNVCVVNDTEHNSLA